MKGGRVKTLVARDPGFALLIPGVGKGTRLSGGVGGVVGV